LKVLSESGVPQAEVLAIDFPAVPNTKDQHDQAVVFDFADQTVVTYPVFPKLPKLRAVECFSYAARIVQTRYSLVQELQDALSMLRVEFAEFPLR